jgi:hypothetical protein
MKYFVLGTHHALNPSFAYTVKEEIISAEQMVAVFERFLNQHSKFSILHLVH